jgi:hypothetical protein
MKLFNKTLFGLGVLALALTIEAQAAPQRYVFHDSQDAKTLFGPIRSDLDRAQHDAFPRNTDSIEKARGELNELERQWDTRKYDPRQAEDVIVALQRILSENHLSPGDRGRLSDDLSRLRVFLESHQ